VDERPGIRAQVSHLVICAIGHSSQSTVELLDLLRSRGARTLVDNRTVPRSLRNPQFEQGLGPGSWSRRWRG
jgi:hypothetical protein